MKAPSLSMLMLLTPLMSLVADVRINEFLASNSETAQTTAGHFEDWIEIYNSGPDSVNLEGYYLTDSEAFSPDDPKTFWQFPKVEIASEGFLVVYASGSEEPSGFELHANFKLANDGDRLALIAPDGTTILTDFNPSYPEQRRDVSYGYHSDDTFQFFPSPTPGVTNRNGVTGFVDDVTFSVSHGFYEAPFTLELRTATEGAEIRYTLDDREPGSGTIFSGPIGQVYSGPITLTKTTVVRALATKQGMQESLLRTQTYLFLDDVLRQPKQPEGFPSKWGTRTPDYEMDPEVVGTIYKDEEVKAALVSIPSISLVTENDNLFASDGIYTNSQAKDLVNDGIADIWERPVSVELFGFPHGQSIQANAGIRMQGNASRDPNRVKHNMRIIFRADYGPEKLQFRLFEDSEIDRFNSLNLRSNNGDSWINPGVRLRAQYVRDQWHREVQRLMGMPNQSQIYAHLYINGLYWGLYHVFERFEASLLSEHFGSSEEDWDALQDTPAFQDIVVNGDDQAFRLTHQLAKQDLTNAANYEELLKYVDVDNQIDYLLINFYSGNQDWDHKNMRYARRRVPLENNPIGNGWTYFAWDSERAGLNGLNDQSLTLDNTIKTTALGPTTLNAEMHENQDYHLRFADRVVKHLFNEGELTPAKAARSWNALADLVYTPLIGESARWGDLHVVKPEIREGNWQTQLDKENTIWFPNRTSVLLDQLSKRGFIPRKPAFPQFHPFGGPIESGSAVKMTIFNSTVFTPVPGDIYYTLDGSDPRLTDGMLNSAASRYDASTPPVIDHALTMMARVYNDAKDEWSALSEAFFHLAPLATKDSLILSEIHYAPAAATAEEESAGFATPDFEFLEFQNTSAHMIDLSGVHITNGVEASIANDAKVRLAPSAFAIIAANRDAFLMRYPHINAEMVVGEFVRGTNLNNGGEQLTLRDHRGLLLHTVRYQDKAPWPSWPTREGRSLMFQGVRGPSIAHPGNWITGPIGGTPGAETITSPPGESLSTWLTAHGLSDGSDAVGAAEQPALLYYAFGIDDFSQVLTPALTLHNDEDSYQVIHTRRVDGSEIVWALESSDDLRLWTVTPATVTVLSSEGTVETVSLALPTKVQYWRLRVSTP